MTNYSNSSRTPFSIVGAFATDGNRVISAITLAFGIFVILAITESLGLTHLNIVDNIGAALSAAFASIADGITSLFATAPVVEQGQLIEVAY